MRYVRVFLAVLLCGCLIASAPAADTTPRSTEPLAAGEDPPVGLPFVRSISTIPEHPIDGDFVQIQLAGWFPTPCGEVLPESTVSSTRFAIRLVPRPVCRDSTGWWWTFDVGALRAGTYRVEIMLALARSATGPPAEVHRTAFEFTVARRDTSPPPPVIPGPLPFVDAIRIAPQPNLLPVERQICPEDSILVSFAGRFPSDCWSLDRIDVIHYPTMGLVPAPPVLRLIVDDNACLDRACVERPTPWRESVTIGSLPRGRYALRVELAKVSCADSITPGDSLHSTHVPFRVDSCNVPPPPGACLFGSWEHQNALGQCDAYVAPDQPAQVMFTVFSPVALSGLQGRLHLSPPGLAITRLEPIGPASGMRLSWNPTDDGGARFVLFAEEGAPIRPGRPEPLAVLRVTVSMLAIAMPPPASVYVTATDLLGADAEGNGVPECAIRTTEPGAFRIVAARICTQRECDFNADGRLDVRDLVLMIRCLRGAPGCSDSSRFDCTQNGSFALDDVFCCATRLLGRPPCTNCPPDTTFKRPEPSVRLAFGAPVGDGDQLTLPIRFESASLLGAARFALRYPADRYDVAGVEFVNAASDWLTLHEIQDGRVVVGFLQTNPFTDGVESLKSMEVLLRLALKPGSEAGGEVTCTDDEFSGTDGVPLEITVERSSPPLGGPAPIALSENRPNPFAGSTRFSLTLGRASQVEIGVYDVTGRRVSSVHSGLLDAGSHEFVWDGRTESGLAASSGIYFVRANLPGGTVSRRMVLLRSN